MRDRELYASILGLSAPWEVADVELRLDDGQVVVRVEYASAVEVRCPECGKVCPRHDHRTRQWRHLDTCQYQTILEARVPRVSCPDHKVRQILVPWSEPGSPFTALMESLIIDWLREGSISSVARLMTLTWDEVDGVMRRAVRRGLERRAPLDLRRIGVDETSFQKRHEYVTIVNDLDRGCVVHVADSRKQEALEAFFEGLSPEQLTNIDAVVMDMWYPFMLAMALHVPDFEKKLAFDKFHVIQYLNEAVDKVRRQENRQLVKEGDQRLKGTKYLWLQRPNDLEGDRKLQFSTLKDMALKVSRAWAIKEAATSLWGYRTRGWARKAWNRWYAWAIRSRLEPIKKAARTIRYHLEGILNADVLGVTNAKAESFNAVVQRIKARACGFRNRERFRNAIYFHLGKLDLHPRVAGPTHTDS